MLAFGDGVPCQGGLRIVGRWCQLYVLRSLGCVGTAPDALVFHLLAGGLAHVCHGGEAVVDARVHLHVLSDGLAGLYVGVFKLVHLPARGNQYLGDLGQIGARYGFGRCHVCHGGLQLALWCKSPAELACSRRVDRRCHRAGLHADIGKLQCAFLSLGRGAMEAYVIIAFFVDCDAILIQGHLFLGICCRSNNLRCQSLYGRGLSDACAHRDTRSARTHHSQFERQDIAAGWQMDGHCNQPVVVGVNVVCVWHHTGGISVDSAVLPFAVVVVDIDGCVILYFGTILAKVVFKGNLYGVGGRFLSHGNLRRCGGIVLTRSTHLSDGALRRDAHGTFRHSRSRYGGKRQHAGCN